MVKLAAFTTLNLFEGHFIDFNKRTNWPLSLKRQ